MITPSSHPIRCALYASAASMPHFERAVGAAPDELIIDLEDGTPPDERALSRLSIGTLIDACRRRDIAAGLRINGAGTEWHEADVVAALESRPDFVVLPKADVESASAVQPRLAEADIDLWVMAETVRDALRSGDMLHRVRVAALTLGYGDLCHELGLPLGADHTEFIALRTAVLDATAAHGIAALDGVVFEREPHAVEAACRRSIERGFAGRTLYHPSHVASFRRAVAATGN